MPHKFDADCRDKIPKQKHLVTNWAEYNEGLRRRGDLTVWISEDALSLWAAPRRTTPGGQPHYSDLAIELCLTLGLVFKQPLRQTQGLMRSIARVLEVEIAVPDFSTLSRRGNDLILQKRPRADRKAAIQLTVDSTGLKIFGEGEWLEEKHKTKGKRRSWRKLHLGLALVSGEIVCSDLTTDDVGDPTALPNLLDQIDDPVDLFLAPSHGLQANRAKGLAGQWTVLMMEGQHASCLPNALGRRSRSRSRLPGTRYSARTRPVTRPFAITILLTYSHTGA